MSSQNTELSVETIKYLYENNLKIVMKEIEGGMEVFIDDKK